jgi:hypothetical protein
MRKGQQTAENLVVGFIVAAAGVCVGLISIYIYIADLGA